MTRQRITGLLLNIVLSIVSFAFFLSIGEFAVWFLEPESDTSFFVSSNEGPRVKMVPGWQGIYCGRQVSINLSGYRGPEVPVERSAAPRIAVYGDSHTFGIGVGDGDSYPAVTSRLLEADLDMPVEVVNLGVPGFEVSDVAAHFHNTFPSFQPDIVILTYNYGDITSSQIVIEPGGQTRVGLAVHGQRGSWRTDARALKALLYSKSMLMRFLIPRVDSTLRPDVIPFLDPQSEPEYREVADNGTKWRSARAHVESMLRTTEAAGASMLVVMYPPSLCDFLCYGDLYAMVQARFEDMGIRVINPRHRFEGAKASDYQATLLDNHPDEASYRMVAEEVERALAALLRSRGLAD